MRHDDNPVELNGIPFNTTPTLSLIKLILQEEFTSDLSNHPRILLGKFIVYSHPTLGGFDLVLLV
jgi:hypothetical protein